MSKSILAAASAAVAIALSAAPAHAVSSYVTFSGNGFANVPNGSNSSTINPTQQVLLDAFFNNGGAKPFSITFQYDDTAPRVGGQFAASLVSATANGNTSLFNGFDAFIIQEQASFNFTWDIMHFVLKKTGHGGPTATTEAYFTLIDSQGGLFANASTLPMGLINTAIIDSVGVDLRVQNGAFSLFGGGGVSTQLAPPPGAGGVPEPATWAMMLIGFFGLGSLLRQRRALAAA
jgi:hypothetical protein